ncbi:DUF2913 family protein [Vibrio lentus]
MRRKSGDYPQLVNDLVINTLLHLYMECSDTRRFVPLHQRNAIVMRYLKSLLKKAAYKETRKDIKALIYAGQKGDKLEEQLWRLKSLVNNYGNDVENFYGFLNLIESTLAIYSELFKENTAVVSNRVYLLADHIDNGFDDNGKQVAPIALSVNSSKWKQIPALAEEHGHFYIEILDSDESKANLYVHPAAMKRAVHKEHEKECD